MPVCAQLKQSVSTATGPSTNWIVYVDKSSTAQTDLTQCPFILVIGQEWHASAMLANSAMPVQSGSSASGTPEQAFDTLQASGFFGFAMAMTISIWALAHSGGEIVDFLRKR